MVPNEAGRDSSVGSASGFGLRGHGFESARVTLGGTSAVASPYQAVKFTLRIITQAMLDSPWL